MSQIRSNHFLQATLVALLWGTFDCNSVAQEYDLAIRGGMIVDGTGNPWYRADVCIAGDRIVAIRRTGLAKGKREINADGLIVSPGFIDIHSHSDYVLLEDGKAQSKIRQGVTTEILGEGSSAGPAQGKLGARRATVNGKEVEWTTLGEYFDVIDRATVSVNVASYVGLGSVWQCVMGNSFDRPTSSQLTEMERLVDQAMKDGALGLSSQVMMPPGSLATTDDIIRLCRVVARHGGIYSTHIRNEGDGVFDSVSEAIEIGERAGVPVDVIHLKIADQQYWGRMSDVITLVDSARNRGVNVQANVYPYTRGNNNLVSIIPPWAHEGGRGKLIERLKDPEQQTKIKRDILGGLPGWYNHFTAVGNDWSRILVSGKNQYEGLTMDRVMALRTEGNEDADLLNELFKILVEEDGSVGAVYAHHTEDDMNLAMMQPWCSIGSDGSAFAIDGPLRRGNPHPRNFGTFPRVLGVYVRERNVLSLEDAVRKMTSLNATKVGIRDRGSIAVGQFADITVFDPDSVIDLATYTQPFQYNKGIRHVVVNGKIVLDNGEHTGDRPGRAIRDGS